MEKGNTTAAFIAGIIVTVLAISTVLLFFKNRDLQSKALTTSNKAEISQTATPSPYNDNETPSPSPSVAVIFESEANIPLADRQQIQARIIDPFLLYYSELNNASYVQTITISQNSGTNKKEFPYLAKYVFKDGVNGGFVVSKSDTGIAWWQPECMGECPFSDNFKAKYPEVVNLIP